MSFHLFISRISFEYDGAVEPLFDELSLSFPGGFTGVVGANGCGKSTLLKLLTGLLTPDRGTVSASGPAVFCMQEVFEPPDGAADLFTATDGYAFRLCEISSSRRRCSRVGRRFHSVSAKSSRLPRRCSNSRIFCASTNLPIIWTPPAANYCCANSPRFAASA